ncbi:MAG: NAD(P)H-hydrate dehydratase [Thermoplasmatales archaeon]|nr:NAD(P)H-hydrate dehydratase [Thermoplasmatales archaeon]
METKILDKNAEFFGVTTEQLMENAGRAIANEAKKLPFKRWLILCGPGNNGGDGYVASRYIKNCRVIVIEKPKTKLAMKNFRRAKTKCKIYHYSKEKFIQLLEESDAVIDAMLGIGIKGELKEPYRQIVEILNRSEKFILSVDVPTGFGSDLMLNPNLTITFHLVKDGMDERCGKILVADIGIPKEAEQYVGAGELILYPRRRKDSHKGENGIVAIIGGGAYTGAPFLAGMSALRAGCDLVYICCPSSVWSVIASFSPDLVVRKMSGDFLTVDGLKEVEDVIEKADAILVGPGLGKNKEIIEACKFIFENYDKKFVYDADAIESLKGMKCNQRVVITPHSGEFKRLTGIDLPSEIDERAKIIKNEAKKLDATILAKGVIDIISDGKRLKMNKIHNEGMTVGGTGDTLAGICCAMLAKKIEPFYSACISAFINGMAGNMAYEEKGNITATDLIEKIPIVIKKFTQE